MPASDKNRSNRRVALSVVGIVVAMAGLAYASVPLYDLFCKVTGFAGTPLRAEAPAAGQGAGSDLPMIEVRFNADTSSSLSWEFEPEQRSVQSKPGEPFLAYFTAKNMSSQPVTGTATFNVVPLKASPYFNKIACFCFDRQELQPGEEMRMPVSFWIDPAMLKNKNTDEVRSVTLSYTFFKALPE